MSIDFEKDEYFSLVKTISDSDQRLLTIKSWGVTLSLVSLGLGFQYKAFGFFIIAAISSLAFWIVEYATRQHQMRHYVRMREIELNNYLRASEDDRPMSAPRIDWSWHSAKDILLGISDSSSNVVITPKRENFWFRHAWALPHVALPHILTLAVCIMLACFSITGYLAEFTIGASPVSH